MVILSIIYGSLKPSSDIDVLNILPGNKHYSCIQNGPFDIIEVGFDNFIGELYHFDPLYTEPVLTGKLIWGSHLQHFYLQDMLLSRKPDAEAVRFLEGKGKWLYEGTMQMLKIAPKSKYKDIASNLMFAASYASFANIYKRFSQVKTLNEIKEEEEFIKYILPSRELFKQYEKGGAPADIGLTDISKKIGEIIH